MPNHYRSSEFIFKSYKEPVVWLKSCHWDPNPNLIDQDIGKMFRNAEGVDKKYADLYKAIFASVKRSRMEWWEDGEMPHWFANSDNYCHKRTTEIICRAGFAFAKKPFSDKDIIFLKISAFCQVISIDNVSNKTMRAINEWWNGDKWALDWRIGTEFDPVKYVEQMSVTIDDDDDEEKNDKEKDDEEKGEEVPDGGSKVIEEELILGGLSDEDIENATSLIALSQEAEKEIEELKKPENPKPWMINPYKRKLPTQNTYKEKNFVKGFALSANRIQVVTPEKKKQKKNKA
jgi:hypothetical protein